MVEQIVKSINNKIAGMLSDKKTAIYGISQPVIVNDKGGQNIYPAIFDENGEGKYVFLDDRCDFGCYHKLQGTNYSEIKGYGRHNTDVEIDELTIVCWGARDKLNMTDEQVEKNIIIPSIPTEAQLVKTNFNKLSIFNSEFKGVEYMVRPNDILFSLTYKVQYKFNRACRETQ